MICSTSMMPSRRMIGEMSMPPSVGQKIADRPQQRLGQRQEQVPDRADEIVADVDDVEGDQPGQHRAGDDDELVEVEGFDDDIEDGAHQFFLSFETACRGRRRSLDPTRTTLVDTARART